MRGRTSDVYVLGGVGGVKDSFDLTEETPHYVRGDKRGKQRRLLVVSLLGVTGRKEETPRRFAPRGDKEKFSGEY